MSAPNPATGHATPPEAVWAELNLHLKRSKGLCLVFLCSDSPAALALMRTRVEDGWSLRSAPMFTLRPQEASTAAVTVLHTLQAQARDRPELRAPVWVDLTPIDVAGQADWERARVEVLSRLNEWRSWLQDAFKRPLLFALPARWRQRMAQVAPDLWHVRAYSAEVAAPEAVQLVSRRPDRQARTVATPSRLNWLCSTCS